MKILVISLAGIGDTLLSTPLIHELRANFPDARIDALVLRPASKELYGGNPHLNTVYQHNFITAGKMESWRFLRMLARQRYDASINTHPQSKIAYRVIARLAAAKTRISHDYECSGALDRLLVNRTLPQDYLKHSIENNFDLLPLLGAKPVLPKHEMEIYLSASDREWAEAFVRAHNLSARKVLGVHIGSGSTKNLRFKRWPLENYLALFRQLKQSQPNVTALLLGGPDEETDMQRVVAEISAPFAIRAETKNLLQAAALLARCDAFLSVDTNLMHMAAAMKVPRQVVIEAFTLNRTNEPYGNPFTLVPNPAVGGRHLEYYRYDGRGIQGSDEELLRVMSSVQVDSVRAVLAQKLAD